MRPSLKDRSRPSADAVLLPNPSRTRWFALSSVVLAGEPWDWLVPFLDAFQRWIRSDMVRELPGNAALFLILGGLSILSLIVFLVILQSFVPVRALATTVPDQRDIERQLRGVRPRANLPRPLAGGTLETGRGEGRVVRAQDLDGVLDNVVHRGIGEPRILLMSKNQFRIRMFGCATCEPTFAAQRTSPGTGCFHELGFLEAALGRLYGAVQVGEPACRLRGQPYCEFEVSH